MSFDNKLDDSFIRDVRDRNDIVDVISSYVNLTKVGDNYSGLCPFHNEKTPSFMVNEAKQIFKCFGCGQGGDVISFIMQREHLDFIDSLKFLCERAQIPWPRTRNLSDEEKRELDEKRRTKDRMYKLHKRLAQFYRNCLFSYKGQPYQYLINRGINNETILKFGLGYAPKGDLAKNFLLNDGFTKEELILSGVFRERENNRITTIFYDRVIFPIFDIRFNVVGFGGRILNGNGPKYINSPTNIIYNKKDILYCLNFAKKFNFDKIILCEGYLDVISLYKNGIIGAVASLGTSLTKEQAHIIKNLGKPVYICYDSDGAGMKAATRAISILKSENVNPLVINLGDCKDPDDFLKKYSKNDFIDRINSAYNSLRYSLIVLSKDYDLSQHAQRMLYINKASFILKKHDNPVEVESEIRRLSQEFNISVKSIGKMVYGKYFSEKQFSNKSDFKYTEPQRYEIIKAADSLEDSLVEIIRANEFYILTINDMLPEKIIKNFENYGYISNILDKYLGYEKSQFNFNPDILNRINIITTNIKINYYSKILNDLENKRKTKSYSGEELVVINNEIIKMRKNIDILKNELQLFGGDVNFGKGK